MDILLSLSPESLSPDPAASRSSTKPSLIEQEAYEFLLPALPNPWADQSKGQLSLSLFIDSGFSAAQIKSIAHAMDLLASIIPMTWFFEQKSASEANTSANPALIITLDDSIAFAGQASLPSGPHPGLMVLNPQLLGDLSQGGSGFDTLLHELGHVLGLKHPGLYEAGDAALGSRVMPAVDDGKRYTVMSYFEEFQQQQRVDWGLLDVAALRALYGGREKSSGNNWYFFQDEDGLVLRTLVDDGGRDVLDLSGLTLGAQVSLLEGSLSSVGFASGGIPAVDNLGIAFGTNLEFIIGTSFDDVFIGSDRAETFLPGLGQDNIQAGGGIDSVRIPGAYTLDDQGLPNTMAVSLKRSDSDEGEEARWLIDGQGFSYVLKEVERLQFSGGVFLAIDVMGHAGQTYRLLEALDQAAPSKARIGQCLAELDRGVSLQDLAAQCLRDASGALSMETANAHPDAFVAALYEQVLGRDPDPAGFQWWVQMLSQNLVPAQEVFIAFTESSENQVHVFPAIAAGIAYDPLGG